MFAPDGRLPPAFGTSDATMDRDGAGVIQTVDP
jgi:hypothetical protein